MRPDIGGRSRPSAAAAARERTWGRRGASSACSNLLWPLRTLSAEARDSGRIEIEFRLVGIEAERAELQAMLRRGDINDHTARKLLTEITFSEAILKGREPRD
ncbi:hypothetical protein EOA23_06835 [Mesorhizobium sp. M2A.F.Ca.ET.042.01.1.1]|uniref:hypothetical protein n=1 Tax=Mesorhizobium sp. M2A.F.Ca.ET.042.01.1.1 TaxID=2496745 RepID=UPI000FC9B777|nr:hypothetical protein [Mesorhizobium sp. M2A.F.Ca.ET.042.01.1.1]RUX33392.1 hypothetical protein EOA23_06835 [Mesorhizobium sp. M2A.F.Ca.ET.042.01.1.1]